MTALRQFVLTAGDQRDHAVILVRTRFGVLVGSGIGGITTLLDTHDVLNAKGPDRVSPFFIPMLIVNMASGLISMRFGAKGPNSSVVTACATGNHALGDAMRLIERGDADWGFASNPILFDPARGLAKKYGVNKSRFWVKPGLAFNGYALNTSRRLFRNNPQLRQAVNFAIDRASLEGAGPSPRSWE